MEKTREEEEEEEEERKSSSEEGIASEFYEMTARRLFVMDPVAHCEWLNVPVTGTPEILPEALPSVTLPGDILLVRVAPDRLVQVQYSLDAPDDLEPRMMMYQSMIRRAYPNDQLTQHVIVLRGGPPDSSAGPGDDVGSAELTDAGG
jgi:hypothetical protein